MKGIYLLLSFSMLIEITTNTVQIINYLHKSLLDPLYNVTDTMKEFLNNREKVISQTKVKFSNEDKTFNINLQLEQPWFNIDEDFELLTKDEFLIYHLRDGKQINLDFSVTATNQINSTTKTITCDGLFKLNIVNFNFKTNITYNSNILFSTFIDFNMLGVKESDYFDNFECSPNDNTSTLKEIISYSVNKNLTIPEIRDIFIYNIKSLLKINTIFKSQSIEAIKQNSNKLYFIQTKPSTSDNEYFTNYLNGIIRSTETNNTIDFKDFNPLNGNNQTFISIYTLNQIIKLKIDADQRIISRPDAKDLFSNTLLIEDIGTFLPDLYKIHMRNQKIIISIKYSLIDGFIEFNNKESRSEYFVKSKFIIELYLANTEISLIKLYFEILHNVEVVFVDNDNKIVKQSDKFNLLLKPPTLDDINATGYDYGEVIYDKVEQTFFPKIKNYFQENKFVLVNPIYLYYSTNYIKIEEKGVVIGSFLKVTTN